MVKNYDVITIISKYLLRKPGVDNFADIIKIVTTFIKKNFKDSKKNQKNINYVPKSNLYFHFLIKQNLPISDEKVLMSAELRECVRIFAYFLDFL